MSLNHLNVDYEIESHKPKRKGTGCRMKKMGKETNTMPWLTKGEDSGIHHGEGSRDEKQKKPKHN